MQVLIISAATDNWYLPCRVGQSITHAHSSASYELPILPLGTKIVHKFGLIYKP